MKFIIRKATPEDIDSVAMIYRLIHEEESAGRCRIGWNPDIYPVRQTAEDALERGDLFVCESDGVVLASAIINSCQEPCYSGGDWTPGVNDSEVLVLHTLTVDPRMAGKGIGRSFVAFYEDYARANGYHSLRLDTQTVNDIGRRLYPRLGYRQAGIVDTDFHGLRAICLILFEKMI